MPRKGGTPANLRPFKKGDPRINRNGAPPKWRELKELIELLTTEKDRDEVLAKLLSLAKSGNLKAIEILLDRMYGKPNQKIELPTDLININIVKRDG